MEEITWNMKIESYEDDFDSPDFWYFERICVSIKN